MEMNENRCKSISAAFVVVVVVVVIVFVGAVVDFWENNKSFLYLYLLFVKVIGKKCISLKNFQLEWVIWINDNCF